MANTPNIILVHFPYHFLRRGFTVNYLFMGQSDKDKPIFLKINRVIIYRCLDILTNRIKYPYYSALSRYSLILFRHSMFSCDRIQEIFEILFFIYNFLQMLYYMNPKVIIFNLLIFFVTGHILKLIT